MIKRFVQIAAMVILAYLAIRYPATVADKAADVVSTARDAVAAVFLTIS